MSIYPPGAAYYAEFTTSSSTGAAANADSTPAATANHNGSDDGAFALSVANLDAGRYKVTGTVPGGYSQGDRFMVSISATIGGIAAKEVIDNCEVRSVVSDSSVAADVQAGLTAQGYSTARAGYLDALSGIVAAIWAAGTRTLTAIADSAGVTTLLSRITGNVAPQTGDSFARLGAPAGASVSADIASANQTLTQALALLGQNQGVRSQVYDANGSLVSADICAYDNPTHAALNDGATGLVHKWALALTYNGGLQQTQSLAQVS